MSIFQNLFRFVLFVSLVFSSLSFVVYFSQQVEAQNKKKQEKIVTNDSECDGVWTGPLTYRDPAIVSKLAKMAGLDDAGNVPIDLTINSCLSVSTKKDKHELSGHLIGELKNYRETLSPLEQKFGKLRSKCVLVHNFWSWADISEIEIRSLKDGDDEKTMVARVYVKVDVGGPKKVGSNELSSVGTLFLNVPVHLYVSENNLVVKLENPKPERPHADPSGFWRRAWNKAINNYHLVTIGSYFFGAIEKTSPSELSLGLSRIKVTVVHSEYANKNWKFNIRYTFEAPENLIRKFVSETKAPAKKPEPEKPCPVEPPLALDPLNSY